jgi:hypothetical protein
MQMPGTSKKALAALAAACIMALMLAAAVDPAEARKGGQFKAPTTGTAKAPPSRVVRDHRGQNPVPQKNKNACKKTIRFCVIGGGQCYVACVP